MTAGTGAVPGEGTGRPCPSCGGARHLLSAERPVIRTCRTCGLMSLGEAPAAELYEEDYYDAASGGRFLSLFEKAVSFFRWLRLRAILRREPGPAAILDVGCGRGDLLEMFVKRGWRAVGTQISRTAAASARRERGVDVRVGELPALDLPARSFRVITFFHVLEHLDDPLSYVTRARDLLEEDGLLVVEVPDHGGLAFRRLGRRHFCFDYPNHRFFFSPATLTGLFERAGFRVEGSSHFSLEYSPFTTLQNLLNALPGPPNTFYRSLMLNPEGGRLRRRPRTWLHAVLAAVLALPAFALSLSSLVLPGGNTLRLYLRKAPG